MKTCSKCGLSKPFTDFYPKATGASGVAAECKCCFNAAAARRYADNPNREHRNLLQASWRAAHPEQRKAHDANYRDSHREQANAASTRWEKEHPEKRKQYTANWRKAHPEKSRKMGVRWRKAHPEMRAATEARRRARKIGNGTGDSALMLVFRKRVNDAPKIRCYWCQEIVPKGKRNIDHIIPLDRGGPDAEFNLCCSCSFCNGSKGTKDPGVFSGQYELPLAVAVAAPA